MAKFSSVEEYLHSFPSNVREVLEEIRRRIHAAVPGGEDVIRYDIAAVQVDGRSVVHYAGWKQHVSLYPAPGPEAGLDDELASYVTGKGTVKFPLSGPVPYDLVGRVAAALASR